ncbi:hypothetical protein KEM54_000684 [Ascosphaera aggregata]|nr:hypothetical protein KEM54_000684 [Ascosphaera aggregata]
MLNWHLTHSHIFAREACTGCIKRCVVPSSRRVNFNRAATVSLYRRNQSNTSTASPSQQSPSSNSSRPWPETISSIDQIPESLRGKNRKSATRKSTTPVDPTTLLGDDKPTAEEDDRMRLVPGYLLRPTKSSLLRYALTDSIRDPALGEPMSEYEKKLEIQLGHAFSQPLLDPDYANRDVRKSERQTFERKLMNEIPMWSAIRSSRTTSQLHDVLEMRLKYISQREALGKSWGVLEKKMYILMNEADEEAAAGRITFAEAEFKKREILMLLRDTLTRLGSKAGAHTKATLLQGYILMMKFSATVFSPQALSASFVSFRENSPPNMCLPLSVAASILRRLTTRLEVLRWENCLNLADAEFMIETLTGRNSAGEPVNGASEGNGALDSAHAATRLRNNLFSMVSWGRSSNSIVKLGELARLLASLGNTSILREAIPLLKQKIEGKSLALKNAAIRTSGACVHACLATGDTELAIRFALLISKVKCIEDVLPKRTVMALLLNDKAMELHDYVKTWKGERFLCEQLSSIERRLGVKWDEVTGSHWFEKSLEFWEDQEATHLEVGGMASGEITALESKVLEEIIQYGSSASVDELSRLVDTLDDIDGMVIPLGTFQPTEQANAFDFAWFPQSSPIEFPSSTRTINLNPLDRSPNSLGLFRARPIVDDKLTHNDRSRDLLQLGYIAAKAASDSQDAKYEPTGHILAWDRNMNSFVIMYVGKGWGKVNPGPIEVYEQQNPLPCVMADIDLEKLMTNRAKGEVRNAIGDMITGLTNEVSQGKWYIDWSGVQWSNLYKWFYTPAESGELAKTIGQKRARDLQRPAETGTGKISTLLYCVVILSCHRLCNFDTSAFVQSDQYG